MAAGGVVTFFGGGTVMIRPDIALDAVYLYRKPVYMRKQSAGLSVLIEGVLQQNPFSGALFVFINKARDKLKILYWERNGYVIWCKRLEEQKFPWPLVDAGDRITITGEELNWLLDGYNLFDFKPHRELHYALAS